MNLCKDCVKGVTWEGTPRGKWQKIGGVDCYVGIPTVDYPKDKAILFLSDVFGPQLVNAQLMVDDFAANGLKTIAPDYLNGDPIPPDAMKPESAFDIPRWLSSHGAERTRPVLDKVISAIAEEKVTAVGATGYCFGRRYTFDLAFDNIIHAAVVSHPSHLEIPADLEKYFATSKAPLLINSCPVDQMFPLEACEIADSIFGDGKFSPGYKREFFDGCVHGFAVRGDINDHKVKEGKEGAFRSAIEWFASNL